MGYYTGLSDLGSRMSTRRGRNRTPEAREAKRTTAPFSCPDCYDTSVVEMDCPACKEPMIRFDEAIVLPGEARGLGWGGWPIVGATFLGIGAFSPIFLASSNRFYFSDMAILLAGLAVMTVGSLAFAGWAYRRQTAPRRKASAAAHRVRKHEVEPAAALGTGGPARVRGVARVRRVDGKRSLVVEDESGQVRVQVDPTLEVYGAGGPRRAISDGDEVEVCGNLVEELGETETYRERRVSLAFAPGATVLIS